jgi:hypothetical protein
MSSFHELAIGFLVYIGFRGGLAIGFLVFLPDEAAGVSTSFLDFWSGKGNLSMRVWVE